jgi:hypothetical protein
MVVETPATYNYTLVQPYGTSTGRSMTSITTTSYNDYNYYSIYDNNNNQADTINNDTVMKTTTRWTIVLSIHTALCMMVTNDNKLQYNTCIIYIIDFIIYINNYLFIQKVVLIRMD